MNSRLPARSYATKSIPLVCLARKAMPKYTQGSQEEAVVYLPIPDRTNRRDPSVYATSSPVIKYPKVHYLVMGLYRRLRTSLTTDINTSTKIQVAEPTHKNAPIASQANPASAQKLEISRSHASLIRRPMYLDNNPAPTKTADMYNVILICNQYILVASPPLPLPDTPPFLPNVCHGYPYTYTHRPKTYPLNYHLNLGFFI